MIKVKEPDLGIVAGFIAAGLNHPAPVLDGGKPVSTILVDQHKQKFNNVRIYCTLAAARLVDEAWITSGGSGQFTEAFIVQRFYADAVHYRRTYLSMIELLPERTVHCVCGSADYPELLCKDKNELELFTGHAENRLAYCLNKYRVSDSDALKKFLCSVSGFKE